MEPEKKLTSKQRRFVEEYLVDLNATQAAIRAGYSEKRAPELGYQLLHKTTVQDALREALAERSARTQISADQVIKELARIAFADPRAVFSWGPGGVSLRSSGELTDDEAAIVAEVSETRSETGGSIKAKLCDKVKALELLGRHLGMFTDKLAVNVSVTPASILETLNGRRAIAGDVTCGNLRPVD
jgi:phage terminase small subunit